MVSESFAATSSAIRSASLRESHPRKMVSATMFVEAARMASTSRPFAAASIWPNSARACRASSWSSRSRVFVSRYLRPMGTVKPEWVPPLTACLHRFQNPSRLQGRRSHLWRLHESCCLLLRIWHRFQDALAGYKIQLYPLDPRPIGGQIRYSVYPLSLAARKNACKVEWWLSVNRDLLLISTLQPERKCSLVNLRIARKVPLHARCLRYRATRRSSVVGTSQQEKGACDRIASLRHGARVHLPLPHGGTVRVYRAGGAHRRGEVAARLLVPPRPERDPRAGGASASAGALLLWDKLQHGHRGRV
jgi:hypothetical protein